MKNIDKQLGSIRTIQARIATGSLQDAETKVYVYNGEHGLDVTRDHGEAVDYDRHCLLAGYYTITHSHCMAGSWAEIIADWASLIKKDMVENGLAEEINEYTTKAIVQNNPIKAPDEATKRRAACIAAMQAVNDAGTFKQEQEALKHAFVVDIRPSLPKGAVDLYHQWDTKQEPETTMDYVEVCKQIGAALDRGARRYVIDESKVQAARDALTAAGFMPCISPALLIGG